MSRSSDCGGGAETPFHSEREEMYRDAATPDLKGEVFEMSESRHDGGEGFVLKYCKRG